MAWLFDLAQLSELADHLIVATAKGIVVLISAAALCFALRRASAASRHLVWTLALTGVLALPLLSFGLPVWEIALLPPVSIGATTIASDKTDAIANTSITTFSTSSTALSTTAQTMVTDKEAHTINPGTIFSQANDGLNAGRVSAAIPATYGWIRWVILLWLVGALAIVGRLLIGTASIWWIAHRASRITDLGWINAANDISWQIGLMRRVRMRKTHSITMPVTCGLINSAILLPADAYDWPDERRQVVLMHELAHVKRWDCLTQLLAQMACSIYWFNPLVWLATRQLRIERERACDDQVIDVGTKASDYASHLLDMARTFRSARCSSLATVAIARRSELEGRLLAILDPGVKRRGLNRIVAISVVAVIVCVVLPLATMRLSAKTQANTLSRGESIPAPTMHPADQNVVGLGPLVVHPAQRRAEQIASLTTSETSTPLPDETPESQEGKESSTPTQQKDNSAVIDGLRDALKDEDPEVRQHALFALAQIGDQQAVAALVEALKDQSWEVRARAAYGLGLRGGRNGIDGLVGALKDASWQVREQAAWGLGLTGDARAIEPLIVALRDENPDVREKAAWALGLKGDKRSVEPLMGALKDTSAKVRGMAAWALGLKADQRAANALKDALKDSDKGVRQRAAWALGMLLMQRGEGVGGDSGPDVDADPQTEVDREGKVNGGIPGGVSGGVSGGVAGGVSRGIAGGVAAGISGGISGGIGSGVSEGIGIGVGAGITGGVGGGVSTENNRRILRPNPTGNAKSKPKQK